MTQATTTPGVMLDAVGEPEPSAIDDRTLVRRASRGADDDAFTELIRRHQGKIRGLLLRLCHDRTLADDLAQEVFLRAYRGLAGFEGRASFSTWIYRITYNVFLNHRTRVRQHAPLPETYERTTTTTGNRAPLPSSTDLRRDLQQALAQLPERYRVVVVLYYLQDVSYPEIAEVLELPLGTVKTQLHRARSLLRARLHGWDQADVEA